MVHLDRACRQGRLTLQLRAFTALHVKKPFVFRKPVAIFPIGDDFRFDHTLEWEQQYTNFKKVMNYMNADKEMNVKIQFGTIRDYYKAVGSKGNYPSLEGDFYTYTDRDEAYWTGYFTTRMILKRQIRKAENWLRAAEAVAALLRIRGGAVAVGIGGLEQQVTKARRLFAFLQHHDAIAGEGHRNFSLRFLLTVERERK